MVYEKITFNTKEGCDGGTRRHSKLADINPVNH